MPSLYDLDMPRRLPLTPPEYLGTYIDATVNGMYPSTHGGTQAYPSTRYDSLGLKQYSLASNSAYAFVQTPHTAIGKENEGRLGHGMNDPNAGNSCTFSASIVPLLPPICRPGQDSADFRQTQQKLAPPVKEEKATGGVAAHLDYEMEQMAEFVAEMAQGMYDLYESRICLADIDILRSVNPKASVAPAFRKYVLSVLSSTRLPSSTILLALHYLATRMNMLSSHGRYPAGRAQVYHMLTTALLLGSKFLDDNTFQNRSWSEVSNIPVSELNTLELEWLVAIRWDLHVDHEDPQGFSLWRKHWQRWQAKRVETSFRSLKLSALDVNVQRAQPVSKAQLSSMAAFSPACNDENLNMETLNDYNTPRWHSACYDQWPSYQSRTEYSPPSAPQTGPPTPERYGRLADLDFARLPKPSAPRALQSISQARFAAYQSTAYSTPYPQPYVGQNWNGHSTTCGCMSCVPYSEQYVVGLRYGLQSVMG
ncbi:MAG: hypothetical protein L6R40_008204 [Gallowayella cf. fulva]|nr:MAG: hypothetical protein L6R40_008204 [Xanthomendoza cf. fulva]